MRFPSLLLPPDAMTLFSQGDMNSLKQIEETTWVLNRQWLDLLSCSGTPLFVSLDPDSLGQEQKAGLRVALERAAVATAVAEPLDWMDTTCPGEWRFGEERAGFDWFLDWR